MNCVLPIAPHILVPVASYQYLLICSPVWQPQLFTKAPLAKARRSICFKSFSCIHEIELQCHDFLIIALEFVGPVRTEDELPLKEDGIDIARREEHVLFEEIVIVLQPDLGELGWIPG